MLLMNESSCSMEAYSTKAKAEDKRRLLVERRARLKVLLDNERDQLEVHNNYAVCAYALTWESIN